MSHPSPIANLGEVATTTGGNGGKFSFRRSRIGPAIGLQKLGCALFVVPPGKIAFPYHAHSLMEEMCVILEGSGTLRHDGAEHPIRAGDVIASPVGKPHQIVNTSSADLRYLVISNNEPVDVVVYPDSNKIGALSSAFGKTLWHVTGRNAATDYYDGEA